MDDDAGRAVPGCRRCCVQPPTAVRAAREAARSSRACRPAARLAAVPLLYARRPRARVQGWRRSRPWSPDRDVRAAAPLRLCGPAGRAAPAHHFLTTVCPRRTDWFAAVLPLSCSLVLLPREPRGTPVLAARPSAQGCRSFYQPLLSPQPSNSAQVPCLPCGVIQGTYPAFLSNGGTVRTASAQPCGPGCGPPEAARSRSLVPRNPRPGPPGPAARHTPRQPPQPISHASLTKAPLGFDRPGAVSARVRPSSRCDPARRAARW